MIPVSTGSTESLAAPSDGSSDQNDQMVHQDSITLNLAFEQSVLAPIINRLLSILSNPYLVLVARTDVGVNPGYRFNLEQNLEYLLSHPLIKEFVFETPAEAIKRLRLSSNADDA